MKIVRETAETRLDTRLGKSNERESNYTEIVNNSALL